MILIILKERSQFKLGNRYRFDRISNQYFNAGVIIDTADIVGENLSHLDFCCIAQEYSRLADRSTEIFKGSAI